MSEVSSGEWRETLIAVPVFIVGLWAILTIIYWAGFVDCTDYYYFNDVGDCTLVAVLESQWEWIKDLFNRIA